MEKTKGKVRRNLWLPHQLNTALMDRALALGIPSNTLVIMGIHEMLKTPDAPSIKGYPGIYTGPSSTAAPPGIYTAPRRFKKLKRRKTDKGYTPPDYFPEDDGSQFPAGIRPVPWAVVKQVGEWMSAAEQEHDPLPQPKDIARHFKMPQADAAVAHDAYVTEFYANQLELLEKKS